MAALTRSSSGRNAHAPLSVLAGLLALAALPAAIYAARRLDELTLPTAVAAAAGAAFMLGLVAIAFARRAHFALELTLGRAGGRHTVRAGRLLGALGICVGITAALAVAFYGLLLYFE